MNLHKFLLTFDTEDIISDNSILGLHNLLELLGKHEITALFFITGNMAEKLFAFPKTVDLLSQHEIGYHGSSHSVHPTIFEFTDVENYLDAYRVSLVRETSHVNPLTGEIEGSGGIKALQMLFPRKKITAFRAPGYCWSPPHMDALKTLGVIYDFSTQICNEPVRYREITFYPFTILLNNWYGYWTGGMLEHIRLQRHVFRRETSVLTIHPSKMVNECDWDSIYYSKFNDRLLNPKNLVRLPPKSPAEVRLIFRKFDLLIRHLGTLQKTHLLRVISKPTPTTKALSPTLEDAEKCYRLSIGWAEGYGYNPKFLHNHFLQFFQLNQTS